MPDRKQFIGRWISWVPGGRVEQELFDDGRFEGVVFEENGSVFGGAKGTWEVQAETIQWRYTSAENIPVPKKVEIDRITHLDDFSFSVQPLRGKRTHWHYRLIESNETSVNLDLSELQPLLIRIAGLVDSGFGQVEIDGFMKKVKRLKPDQSFQSTFPIVFSGVTAPLHIRVFMDDVNAPDTYFYAPKKLAEQIDDEIKRLEIRSGD
jgi:hypothetical protein